MDTISRDMPMSLLTGNPIRGYQGKLEDQKPNLYNVLVVVFVAFGSFAFGYSNTIIGTTLAQPLFM